MNDRQILEVVTERDMDLLVLEELNVCPDFAVWWIDQVTHGQSDSPIAVTAYHSVSHAVLGESDLVLTYENSRSERHAILIENKIDATAQPDQAARYGQRGQAGIDVGDWVRYSTCMFAPARYIDANYHAKSYDSVITYEQVRDWLRLRESFSRRRDYRAAVLDSAIEQNRRGYQPQADARVTQLCRAYWQSASQEFPELEMPEPGPRPAGSSWIEFRPRALGPGKRIYHKLDKGIVDLQIDRAADQASSIAATLGSLLGRDTEVVTTGKSVSIRATVPAIDRFADFESQRSEARTGMRAAYRLLVVARAISSPA
jgi:hypothetical protein